ncbi:N-acetylneuraminate synthase family protein [Polynucleobacter sp. UB-Raua-W9]|uniref:N-acetylneuraminate synthase family protein n=1 Tax=Polynucleobacter sp. UB-Raua-W9 TaxID=1819736 RepID=UPI001BFDCAB0|nr:N-acetylneuraminate synthase family protein [Polynucleobacter sp. UB-Raua-W9]QWD72722.1 N-acetylneuraminate synthase family protein [Polynucleobacter sp. UB-Raua-W9]
MPSFRICGRDIGDEFPPVVIAEIGINHGGSIDVAIAMADSAINAGAEIIKHQTHIVEDEMSDEARSVIPGNADESIYTIMERCALSEIDERLLMQYIQSKGGIFISTPFSRAALERLIQFDVPAYKIGSGECNNYPLIKLVARAKKPVILSTGMNSIETIRPSVDILRKAKIPFALLHCTNVYPTPLNLVRLGAINSLRDAFPDAVIGLSDHTVTNHACFGAVALGASILERHFTDNMKRIGPDIVCSMDPLATKELIAGAKNIYEALGEGKFPVAEEAPTIAFAFASVVVTSDLKVGDILSEENLWLRRPGGGDYGATDFDNLLGKKLIKKISKGERLSLSHINEEKHDKSS